jgi:hypothetical protein
MATIYTGVWAGRPAASAANQGSDMVVTDVPLGARTRWISDGRYWVPEVPVVLLSNGNIGSVVAGAVDGVEVDKVLLDVRIPGVSLRENGRIDLDLHFESNSGGQPTKRRFRVFAGSWLSWQLFGLGSGNAYAFRVSFMAGGPDASSSPSAPMTRLIAASPAFSMGLGVGTEGFAPNGVQNMSGDVSLQVRCAVGPAPDWTRLRSAFVVLR